MLEESNQQDNQQLTMSVRIVLNHIESKVVNTIKQEFVIKESR